MTGWLVVGAVVLYFISIYNRLVALRESVDAAWSDISVQLKRRYDLIPALVEVVKGYRDYESETLENVIKARQMGVSANSIKEHEEANDMLTKSLGRLFALAESYPDLKANTNFTELQLEISHLEDTIQNARRYYNAIVRDYNTKIASFPDLLVANHFGFESREFFELDADEKRDVRDMPKIDFGK
jgi:LemA protein